MSLLLHCNKICGVYFKNVFRTLATQTQTLPQETQEEVKTEILNTRVVKKLPPKNPFMKNVFLGDFDSDVLAFPENLNNEEFRKLVEKRVEVDSSVQSFDPNSTTQPVLKSDLRKELQKLKIFGLQSPETLGGLELNETENCYILESLAQNNSLVVSLVTHQYLGINAILKKGSESLIKKYIPKLSSGESIASFCLLEEDIIDPSGIKTRGVKKEDGSFILNGTKTWVINGSQANTFIVLAQTEAEDSTQLQDKMSVFVVDRSSGGVSVNSLIPSGLRQSDICNVTFTNTPVPAENILGERGDSMKIITSLLSKLRLSTGPICIGAMRKLIRQFTNSILNMKQGQQGYVSDSEFIREKIAQINLDLYAMESMTYMTAGLLDRYEKHDCDLESAIVKVFCSEHLLKAVEKCLLLSGPGAFMDDNWLNKIFRDSLGNVMINETNGSLRMIIALLGLQHTGYHINNTVQKSRNPFFFPGFVVKKMFERRRQEADNPKLELHLENYVHPSLVHAAQFLEYCVYRLQYAAETLLVRHGQHIVEQHMALRRLADVAIEIYGMASVISRASRSYCIGLRNADYEILLANAFCFNARDFVKRTVLEISQGPYGTNDISYKKLAKRAFQYDGYFAEHVLTKNF